MGWFLIISSSPIQKAAREVRQESNAGLHSAVMCVDEPLKCVIPIENAALLQGTRVQY